VTVVSRSPPEVPFVEISMHGGGGMMSVFARAVLSVLVVATMAPGVAPAAEHTSVLFILDASGSMWGRIDGTEKITVAKGP
jgi:hypothetical protein